MLPDVAFEDFVYIDRNLAMASELTDQEIVDHVVLAKHSSSSYSEDDSELCEPQRSGTDTVDMARRL